MPGIKRRDFITLLGGAAAWPLAARAQQRTLGFLSSGAPQAYTQLLAAFRQALAGAGFVEGQNIAIEYRWADGAFDRLPLLAADLVQRQVAVIVSTGITSAIAAKAASSTIPLLFVGGDDPLKFGLVASFNRPGSNATGLSLFTSELTAKRLAIVRELVPTAIVVAVLANPNSPESEPQLSDLRTAARALGQQFRILNASSSRDIDTAFDLLVQQRAGALVVTNDAVFNDERDQIVALAARHAIPSIYDRREYAEAGGLISYGTHYVEAYRQIANYAARILKGEKPTDLPVMRPTKFELVINLKTAKALGMNVPPTLVALADEVIE